MPDRSHCRCAVALRLSDKLDELAKQKVEQERALADTFNRSPNLHPTIAEISRRKISNSAEITEIQEINDEALEFLGNLIGGAWSCTRLKQASKIELLGDILAVVAYGLTQRAKSEKPSAPREGVLGKCGCGGRISSRPTLACNVDLIAVRAWKVFGAVFCAVILLPAWRYHSSGPALNPPTLSACPSLEQGPAAQAIDPTARWVAVRSKSRRPHRSWSWI